MATTLPMRPATSGGTSSSQGRRPSLTSFPVEKRTPTPLSKPVLQSLRQGGTPASPASTTHSTSSSLSGPQISANGTARHTRPAERRNTRTVRSQYPADSGEKHVEYILVASFDIDRGSMMEHQYPGPVGGDEVMLAELMLPDQTHTRSQDWTVFFLHKDADTEQDQRRKRKARRKKRRKDATAGADNDEIAAEDETIEDEDHNDLSDFEVVDLDGPPLVYVLNLVNTKQDNTVRRGAIVKAMAICTRHSFLHIYKPLLLLALEQYFASPTVETLAGLYESVNSMDLSLMPRLNPYERAILQATSAKTLFIEKFEAMITERMSGSPDHSTTTSPVAQQPHFRYGLPRDTHDFDTIVQYANVPVPVKIPTALTAETVGDFSLVKLINKFAGPHSSAPVAFSPTHAHLTTSGPMTHPIIVLLNALLTQKRIIFLGHNMPSYEVAEAVLAACSLASGGILRGFTRYAFPYTDLTKVDDLLKVPGFIAGVTNPAFAHKSEWWDVLCDMQKGRMTISSKIEPAPATEGTAYFQSHTSVATQAEYSGDAAFMAGVLSAINNRHGENAIRIQFQRWVAKFTRLAAAFEDTVYGASALHVHDASSSTPNPPFASSFDAKSTRSDSRGPQTPTSARPTGEMPAEVSGHGYVWATPAQKTAELTAHATRIEGWRSTRSYYNYVRDLAAFYSLRAVKSLDLQHLHDKLSKLRLTPDVSANIYLAICAAIQTENEISHLLATVVYSMGEVKHGPQGLGASLFHIAYGLFHPRPDVREAVADLLGRIQEHEAGRHFWAALGTYFKTAWSRLSRTKDGNDGDEFF